MPGNHAEVSGSITGRTVGPLGRHKPYCMDRTVGSTVIFQIPHQQAFASPPVRMETKVSDIIFSTLPGRPEMVGVLSSATVTTSLLLRSTFPSGPMRPYWAGAQPAMACRPRDAGAWRRQNNTPIVWNSKQPF